LFDWFVLVDISGNCMLLGDIHLWTEGEGTQRWNTSLFYEVSFLFLGAMLSSMTSSRSFDEMTGSTVGRAFTGRVILFSLCYGSFTVGVLLDPFRLLAVYSLTPLDLSVPNGLP
jgi:hypothetical protein